MHPMVPVNLFIFASQVNGSMESSRFAAYKIILSTNRDNVKVFFPNQIVLLFPYLLYQWFPQTILNRRIKPGFFFFIMEEKLQSFNNSSDGIRTATWFGFC